MRRTGFILLAACLFGSTHALHAQESGSLHTKADSVARSLLIFPQEHLSADWLKEAVDPIRQQRRELRNLMERRAQQSVVQLPQDRTSFDLRKEIGLWRWSVGNTGVTNWSPYQDRALDARTISLPLPRAMKPDKR